MSRLSSSLSRSSILITLLFLCNSVCVLGQSTPSPVTLSDRVGPVITPDEQVYFNLFHRFPGFKQASFSVVEDSLRVLEVVSNVNGSDVIQTDTLDTKAFNELARYIDQFERLYNKTREVNWGLIIPYTGPKRWNRRRANVTVTLLDRKKYEGRLVFVDNNQMILNPGKEKVPYLPQVDLLHIDPALIESVRIRYGFVQTILRGVEEFLFFSRSRYIFGNQERYQKQVVPSLVGQSVFSDANPPEMGAARALTPIALTRPAIPAEKLYLNRINRQWTLKLNATSPLSRSVKAIPFSSFGEEAGDYNIELTDLIYHASLQKNISRRLRLGGIVQYYPTSRVNPINYYDPETAIPLPLAQREDSRIQLSGFSFTPTFSFLIAVPDKRRFALEREIAFLDRFELAVSVGPTFSSTTNHASISPSDLIYLYTGFLVQVHSLSWSDFNIGGLALVDLFFYPREYISIGFTGEYLALSFQSIDLAAIENPLQEGVNYETRSFVAPSTLLEQFSLNFGVRFHF